MVPASVIENELIEIKRQPWVENFFRPLLITVMIMCFNMAVVNLVRVFNPAWRGAYFLIAMLLTTIEAIYSYRVLHRWRAGGISVMRYRLTEWAILLIMLKILLLVGAPPAQLWSDLRAMWQDPLNNLLDLEFFVLFVLAMLAWTIATNTIADYEALHDPWSFRSDNILPLDDLASRFFWGGILLVLISGIAHWGVKAGLASLVDFTRPSLGGIVLNVLIYFTLGLVLLSQAHLTTLLVRWQIQKITISAELIKQWVRYGAIFLGIVGLLVFWLPTRYTLGFLTSAGIVIGVILRAIIFIVQILLFLIHLPLYWLLSLLGQPSSQSMPPPLPPAPPVSPGAPAGGAPPWLEALQSLIFWLIAGVIIGYLFKFYLDDHPELVKSLKNFKPAALLLRLSRWLWARLTGAMRAGMRLIPKKKERPAPAGQPTAAGRGWNWFGRRGASPRRQILAYYLNLLKRAEASGPARQKHQTPYEYEPDLSQAVPRLQTEVEAVTRAFVEARYSRQAFDQTQARQVKQQWQQIRRELRGRGKLH
ncbi:MAG: DUF4129 domain-containing protein [Chloroflexota bacterium]